MTAYATPSLLGGTKTKVLSTLLDQYANINSDWLSASMVATVMIIFTVLVNVVFTQVAGRMNRRQNA